MARAGRGRRELIPSLRIEAPADRPLRLLALGAHPDDIEIGAAGLVARLVAETPRLSVRWLIASGVEPRVEEAHRSAEACSRASTSRWTSPASATATCRSAARDPRSGSPATPTSCPTSSCAPGAATPTRTIACSASSCGRCSATAWCWSTRSPSSTATSAGPTCTPSSTRPRPERKVRTILDAFPSQRDRRWFNAETFWALLRLRGLEAGAESGCAEAFHGTKIRI